MTIDGVLAVALEAIDDAVLVTGAGSGRILYANPAYARLVGQAVDELVGQRPAAVPTSTLPGVHDVADATASTAAGRPRGLPGVAARAGRGAGERWEARTERQRLPDGREVLVTVVRNVTAESEVAAVERRMAAIVNATDVAVIGLDLHGRIETWNPAAEGMYGHAAAEIVGEPVARLLPPGTRYRRELAALLERVRDGRRAHVETERVHRDGTVLPVAIVQSPLRDADGRVVGVATLHTDLTAYRRIERERGDLERRLEVLADRVDGVVYVTRLTPRHEVTFVSRGIETLLGIPADEYYEDARLVLRLVHPDDRAVLLGLRDTETSPGRATYRLRHRDGRWVWIENHYVREVDEQGVRLLGIAFDASARKAAEEADQRALAMEQEATRRLRRIIEMQENFLQAVSHEVRTPLTAVVGFSRLLHDHADAMPTERRRLVAERLVANIERLTALMTDVLDLERSMRGGWEPVVADVDLADVCRAVAARVDGAAHRLELELDRTPMRGDRRRLERIVDNLVRNALRHTPAGTPVMVRSGIDAGFAFVVVEDDGPGVPAELVPHLFEPFRQGDAAAAAPSPGTGIGLAIVAEFAKAHAGTAWYEDRSGGGARFVVMLPAEDLPL